MDFQGKSVVITGGATGIGFALAKRIGGAGARIILSEPRQAKLDEAVDMLAARGIDARAFAGDVTDAASVEESWRRRSNAPRSSPPRATSRATTA